MVAPAHSRKIALFTSLNVADLVLTWFLLEQLRGHAYEVNPVASWWLTHCGWMGLIAFKLSIVALVSVLALTVSRRRPRTAGSVLTFGCVVLLAVLFHSGHVVHSAQTQAARENQIDNEGRELDRAFAGRLAFLDLQDRLRDGLRAGECSLIEAVETLGASEYVQNGNWQRTVGHRFAGHTREERLAGYAINYTLGFRNSDATSSPLARDLEAQFAAQFGRYLDRMMATATSPL